jgi:hypothetical protein
VFRHVKETIGCRQSLNQVPSELLVIITSLCSSNMDERRGCCAQGFCSVTTTRTGLSLRQSLAWHTADSDGHAAYYCGLLRCSQVGAIHTLYLYSEMNDMDPPVLSCVRRASAPTSQES